VTVADGTSMATFRTSRGASDSRMEPYLASTDIIDWKHPAVIAQARVLSAGLSDSLLVTRQCFEWVRDEIKHSHDFGLTPLTCTASQVLQERSGYCYAKSHLLAALLRANGIPTGFCYQRLSRDGNGAPFSLHGLNAVRLPHIGWYRVDARGNRDGVDAQFVPPREQLAFSITMPGEAELPEVWPNPLPVVIDALRQHTSAAALYEELPDLPLWVTTG
jgi:transglutaminase-like putative cysteine protease